jgi:hypothetical protein
LRFLDYTAKIVIFAHSIGENETFFCFSIILDLYFSFDGSGYTYRNAVQSAAIWKLSRLWRLFGKHQQHAA